MNYIIWCGVVMENISGGIHLVGRCFHSVLGALDLIPSTTRTEDKIKFRTILYTLIAFLMHLMLSERILSIDSFKCCFKCQLGFIK